MKVFISYSRDDEAVANLLAYILTTHGIQCEIDRRLQAGSQFDSELREMIETADTVLLVLTNSAARSTWVNQEIGFASAHEKRIMPIAFETNIQPEGMISTTQSYSLFDWSNPSDSIERLVKTLRTSAGETASPFRTLGLDHVIRDNSKRCEYIVERLREATRGHRPAVVLNQAAFSIFAVSDEPAYQELGEHSDQLMGAMLAERKALSELVEKGNVELKLIVWPERPYPDEYLALRYRNLLEWMHDTVDEPRVSFVCAQYPGPNRLIVEDRLSIEGFKSKDMPGYDMTMVRYQPEKVEEATREFYRTFDRSFEDNGSTVRRIEEMYSRVTELG